MTNFEKGDDVLVEVLLDMVVLDEEGLANESAVEGLNDKGPEADFEVVFVKDLVDFPTCSILQQV